MPPGGDWLMELSEVELKWSQRLDRERKARRQAEQHAEQGLRELWLSNQRLETAVAERTAELDRSIAALDFASNASRLLLVDLAASLQRPLETLDNLLTSSSQPDDSIPGPQRHSAQALIANAQATAQMLSIAAHASPAALFSVAESRAPQTVLDELVRRWQIPFARRGKLLTPRLVGRADAISVLWQPLVGAADAVLQSAVQHSLAGALEVELVVTDDDVTIRILDAGLALPDEVLRARDEDHGTTVATTWLIGGEQCIGLAVAQRMVDNVTTHLAVSSTDGDGTCIEVRGVRPKDPNQ
jgi:C4-dicarboxylate-specific signal transduction histidine kinase